MPAAVVGLVGGFFQDAGHQAPVADGADHVFSDAQRDDGFVAGENQSIGLGGVDGFLGPAVAQTECFMPGEFCRLCFAVCCPSDH